MASRRRPRRSAALSPRRRAQAEDWLRRAVRRIAKRVRPDKVILFGSYAYGRPRDDSDMDLLVVTSTPRDRFRRYLAVEAAVGEHLWPVDILVRSPREIEARLRIGDPFFQDVLRRGVPLYES